MIPTGDDNDLLSTGAIVVEIKRPSTVENSARKEIK